jgi:hypothetical protein
MPVRRAGFQIVSIRPKKIVPTDATDPKVAGNRVQTALIHALEGHLALALTPSAKSISALPWRGE